MSGGLSIPNPMVIVDEFGEILKTYEVPENRVRFEGVVWEGVELTGAVLANANFAGADLYWSDSVSGELGWRKL